MNPFKDKSIDRPEGLTFYEIEMLKKADRIIFSLKLLVFGMGALIFNAIRTAKIDFSEPVWIRFFYQ